MTLSVELVSVSDSITDASFASLSKIVAVATVSFFLPFFLLFFFILVFVASVSFLYEVLLPLLPCSLLLFLPSSPRISGSMKGPILRDLGDAASEDTEPPEEDNMDDEGDAGVLAGAPVVGGGAV